MGLEGNESPVLAPPVKMLEEFHAIYFKIIIWAHFMHFCICVNYTHDDYKIKKIAICHDSTVELMCKFAYRVIKIESAVHGNIIDGDAVGSSCDVSAIQKLTQVSTSDRCSTNIVPVSEFLRVSSDKFYKSSLLL